MKAGQVVRYLCGECQVVFDLGVDHMREVDGYPIPPDTDFSPTLCPFCGAGEHELKPLNDQPVQVSPRP
jgi:hypothetical protein